MREAGIYKILNGVNGKFYVGSSTDLRKRKSRHFYDLRRGKHPNRHLQAAWDKYGEEAFVFIVVERIALVEDLFAAEDMWLRTHVGQSHCYNIGTEAAAPMRGKGGEDSPTWGYKHTDISRQAIGAASRVRVQSEEEKEKRRATMRGHPVLASTRKKISAALSGAGNPHYGTKRPEFAEKIKKPVLVVAPDGSRTTYPSIMDVRGAFGIKPPTVNRALKSGQPLKKGRLKGYSFFYV